MARARPWTRRRLLGTAGAAALVGLGAGCSGIRAGLTPQSAGGSKDLDFFWYVEGDRAKHSIRAARRFERSRPGVSVTMLNTSYDSYWDRLATETAGGNPPDIFQIELARQAEYAARGALQPVAELIPDLMERIEPDVLEACSYEGETHFIPTGLSTSPALIVNETLVAELDVGVPPTVWTQDQYADFCDRVYDASSGKVFGTSDLGGSHWALQAFGRSRGEDPFSEDGELTLGRETVGDWFQWWDELRASKAAVPMTRSAEGGGFENSSVVSRDAAIDSTASAKGILGLQGLTEDTLNLLSFPLAMSEGPAGVMIAPIEWWAISSRVQPDKALLAGDLCQFVLTDRASVDGMVIEHGIPVVPSLRAEAKRNADPVVRRTFEDFERARESEPRPVKPQPVGAGELFTQVLTKLNQDIGFRRTSVGRAVDAFMAEAGRVLNR